jgi:hypothetical protein
VSCQGGFTRILAPSLAEVEAERSAALCWNEADFALMSKHDFAGQVKSKAATFNALVPTREWLERARLHARCYCVPLSTVPGINDDEVSGDGTLVDVADLGLSFNAETLLDSIDAVGDFTSGGDSSLSDGGGDGGG